MILSLRTVQLLWHQLRVSVLVLKERLLRSLQDSNGNFTHQTDILQAFSEDQHQVPLTHTHTHTHGFVPPLSEPPRTVLMCPMRPVQTRLDALTEVDDCGQLTIRCSQDYFSLDCGITAFELSDYSPEDEPGGRGAELKAPEQNAVPTQEHDPEPAGLSNHREAARASPPQPPPGRRAAPLPDGGPRDPAAVPGLQLPAEMSRSTPFLVDAPDRSRFWLELDSVYPDNVSQSCENLQVSARNLGVRDGPSPPQTLTHL